MMISLGSIIECLLKKDAKLDMFVNEKEFEKYTEEIAEEANRPEEAKEFEERERDLLKSYAASDNPLQSICFFMIRRGLTQLTKKEFVKLFHQFVFIHEQFVKSVCEIKEIVKEACDEKGKEMYY
jgi:hypothetical protein